MPNAQVRIRIGEYVFFPDETEGFGADCWIDCFRGEWSLGFNHMQNQS
jgi:hypothetical protein